MLGLGGTALALALSGCGSVGDAERTGGGGGLTEAPDPTTAPTTTAQSTGGTQTERVRRTGDASSHPRRLALGQSVTTADGWSVSVANARVQRSILAYCRNPARRNVVATEDSQFVVVEVAVRGTDGELGPPPDGRLPLGVSVDGRRVRPDDDRGCEEYFTGDGRGWSPSPARLGFRVPIGRARSAGIVWHRPDDGRVAWLLPDAVVETLASAPRFAVRSFEVPGEARRFGTIEVALDVENVGDRDGTFRADLEWTYPSFQHEIAVDVPAGDTVTYRERLAPPDHDTRVTLVLDWGIDALERTIPVVGQ